MVDYIGMLLLELGWAFFSTHNIALANDLTLLMGFFFNFYFFKELLVEKYWTVNKSFIWVIPHLPGEKLFYFSTDNFFNLIYFILCIWSVNVVLMYPYVRSLFGWLLGLS